MVGSDAFENAAERARLDRTMIGNHLMMLATLLCGHTNMRTPLTGAFAAELAQRFHQLLTGETLRGSFIAP